MEKVVKEPKAVKVPKIEETKGIEEVPPFDVPLINNWQVLNTEQDEKGLLRVTKAYEIPNIGCIVANELSEIVGNDAGFFNVHTSMVFVPSTKIKKIEDENGKVTEIKIVSMYE